MGVGQDSGSQISDEIERREGVRRKFSRAFLHSRGIFLFGVLFLVGIVIVSYQLFQHSKNIVLLMAEEDAIARIDVLRSFRTLYTREVVKKVTKKGFKASHQYQGLPHTVPLPATLTRLLGEDIREQSQGGGIFLYSAYPFPWRKEDGGLSDPFREEAWAFFDAHPSGAFSRVEKVGEKKVLRYAKADLMRVACLNCHNTHPQTPKADWMAGEVRGVLEVQIPLDGIVAKAGSEARFILWTVIAIGLIGTLGLLGMALMSGRARRLSRETRSRREALAFEVREREKAEQILEEQKKKIESSTQMATLGEMAASIAHEIRNPLTSIEGEARKIKRIVEKGVGCTGVDCLAIAENVTSLSNRINQIITGIQASSRKGDNDPFVETKVVKILEDVTILSKLRLKRNQIDFAKSITDPELTIECRETQMIQVLLNLLSNSIDAIQDFEEKWVRICVADIGNDIEISVTDSGRGVSKEAIKNVLNPFFTTKELGKGTGLGLSISKSIIESHNGVFKIDPDSPHTCFIIEVPKKQPSGGSNSK